jgi:hypothetical protein
MSSTTRDLLIAPSAKTMRLNTVSSHCSHNLVTWENVGDLRFSAHRSGAPHTGSLPGCDR